MRRVGLLLGCAILLAAGVFAGGDAWPWRRLQTVTPIVVSAAFSQNADTLRQGETLGDLFLRQGLVSLDIERLVTELGLDPSRLRAGLVFNFRRPVGESEPIEVVVRTSAEERLRMARSDQAWALAKEGVAWETETVRVGGDISSSLYDALDQSIADDILGRGERVRLAWDIADVFAWSVDFTRDIQRGDRYAVLLERRLSEEGEVRYNRVLASELSVGGKPLTAFRFDHNGKTGFYDTDGKSLRRAFLRAPVEFRRISSGFSRSRFHPILKVHRRHAGIDYSAAPGTPVLAAGDGTVVRVGWSGGYGNLVEVRHRNGITTRYGHLRSFARGIRTGARVSQADVIGYVGSTGLSNGPHLHYEFLVNGAQQDPRRVLINAGPPIEAALQPAFEEVRDRYARLLGGPSNRILRPAD